MTWGETETEWRPKKKEAEASVKLDKNEGATQTEQPKDDLDAAKKLSDDLEKTGKIEVVNKPEIDAAYKERHAVIKSPDMPKGGPEVMPEEPKEEPKPIDMAEVNKDMGQPLILPKSRGGRPPVSAEQERARRIKNQNAFYEKHGGRAAYLRKMRAKKRAEKK